MLSVGVRTTAHAGNNLQSRRGPLKPGFRSQFANVVMLCPGSESVKVPFNTVTFDS